MRFHQAFDLGNFFSSLLTLVPSPPFPVPPGMLLPSLCCGLFVLPNGLPPVISWLRRSRLAQSSSSVRTLQCLVGVRRRLGGHQSPLDRLASPSDLALVADDGSTQMARVSLSRASGQGLDQEVATSHR